jgi:hypothetical protein
VAAAPLAPHDPVSALHEAAGVVVADEEAPAAPVAAPVPVPVPVDPDPLE